jgi:hypothetical protein
MQADRVIASQWLIVAHAGIVRMVGTIDGLTIHGGPYRHHRATSARTIRSSGESDPLDNNSQNPVAYGDMNDVT